jgi:hypothetical protein
MVPTQNNVQWVPEDHSPGIVTVPGTRGKQHDNQQQQEYRVIRNGAGNTATHVKIYRYEIQLITTIR